MTLCVAVRHREG